MKILAIDPGTTESAYVLYETDGAAIRGRGKLPNAQLLQLIPSFADIDAFAIEMIASYGMSVGREVFETCVWIGRFIQAWGKPHTTVYRKDVKLNLCGSTRAKDANIRQALIDRFGPGKPRAIGLKATPGPLYGVSGDEWAALAVAVTFADGKTALALNTEG